MGKGKISIRNHYNQRKKIYIPKCSSKVVVIFILIYMFFFFGCKKYSDVVQDEAIKEFRGHTSWVTSVTFSPNGRQALSASIDKTLCLWQVTTGRLEHVFRGHRSKVWSVAFGPDGTYAVSGGISSVRLWDISTVTQGKILMKSSFLSRKAFDRVAFSPCGKYVISNPVRLCVFDISTGKKLRIFEKQHFLRIEDFALSPDGKIVAASNWFSKKIFLWDFLTGNGLGVLGKHKGWVTALAFSPDSKYVLSGSFDQTIRYWEVSTAKEMRTFIGHKGSVWSVAFSPDGRYVLTGGDDMIVHLWNVSTGKELKQFTGHTRPILSVTFSPGGRYALSGSEDHTVRLWDLSVAK